MEEEEALGDDEYDKSLNGLWLHIGRNPSTVCNPSQLPSSLLSALFPLQLTDERKRVHHNKQVLTVLLSSSSSASSSSLVVDSSQFPLSSLKIEMGSGCTSRETSLSQVLAVLCSTLPTRSSQTCTLSLQLAGNTFLH